MIDAERLYKNSTTVTLDYLLSVKKCVVIAPHPDDESLGCGGLISTLGKLKSQIYVLYTTDGSMSHPNSENSNPEERRVIREGEAVRALSMLGVKKENVYFLRGKDSALPIRGQEGFDAFASQISQLIAAVNPDLIVMPYRLDPHCDHRATWEMTKEAINAVHYRGDVFEYAIWLYDLGTEEDLRPLTDAHFCYLDLGEASEIKKMAINQHKSQLMSQVFNDPGGFLLKPEVLAHFTTGREYYIKCS